MSACATNQPDAGARANECASATTPTDGTQTEQALKDTLYAAIKAKLGK
jgi:hypothetical protein